MQFPLLIPLLFLGCRSAPLPPPTPSAIGVADRAEEQAAKLSEQQQNWPAAARAWQLSADRYSLLNDLAGEAIALHNLAQAERELNQSDEADKHLEEAAGINSRIGQTNQWWRNQIALLQVEAQAKQSEALKVRFEKLSHVAGLLRDRDLEGLFLNEIGLWQQSQGELAEAEKSFTEAEQNFTAAKDNVGLATILANRAELYEAKRNFPAAVASWKSALAKFQVLADPEGIARALAGQGRALLADKVNLPAAEDLLRRAAHNYNLLHQPKEAEAALELLARCLTAEGKDTEAESARQESQKAKH